MRGNELAMGRHCDDVGEPNEGRHEETMLTCDQLGHVKKGEIRKRQGGWISTLSRVWYPLVMRLWYEKKLSSQLNSQLSKGLRGIRSGEIHVCGYSSI